MRRAFKVKEQKEHIQTRKIVLAKECLFTMKATKESKFFELETICCEKLSKLKTDRYENAVNFDRKKVSNLPSSL